MGKIALSVLIFAMCISAQPSIGGAVLWKAVRNGLTGPAAADFWEQSVKGAMIPGASVRDGLKGTVLSSEPPDHPTVVTLAMYGASVAEVTIKLSPPFKKGSR